MGGARLAGVLAPAALLAFRGPLQSRPWAPAAAGAAVFVALAPFLGDIPWLQVARPLPLFGLFGVVYALRRVTRGADPVRAGLQLVLLGFALAALAKIFLLARIYQYGFVLAMPATLLLVVALVAWIPGEITRRGGDGRLFRGAAQGLLAAAVAGHLLVMSPFLDAKSARLGAGGDAIRVSPGVARAMARTLATLREDPAPAAPLAVLPEGVMLNYLLRRPTPTPHFSFNPFELRVYGEQEILDGFRSTPPSSVVLIHHDTSEHGARFLGLDYGQSLLAWIRERYRIALQLGDPPLQPGTRFGVAVLRAPEARR